MAIDEPDVPRLWLYPEAGSHCPGCGHVLAWEFDRATASGHLACPRGCSLAPRSPEPTDAPPMAARGSVPGPHTQATPPVGAATTSPGAHGRVHVTGPARDAPAAHPPSTGVGAQQTHTSADPRDGESRDEWYGCGPPAQVRSPTNSWLYVPLLHAALGALTDGALAQWRADPRAAPWWEEARRALAASAPVPVAALTEALIAAAVHNHEALPETALAEAATLPPSTLIHLGWVVRHLAGEDGYITAAGQAVCLETFGGAGFATTLDRRSDIFRHARRLTVTYGAIEPPPLGNAAGQKAEEAASNEPHAQTGPAPQHAEDGTVADLPSGEAAVGVVAPTHGSLPPDRAEACDVQVADAPPAIPAVGDLA